jgi:hypothetical protein
VQKKEDKEGNRLTKGEREHCKGRASLVIVVTKKEIGKETSKESERKRKK